MAGEADTVAGVVGCCLQWKKPDEESFDRDVALGLTIRPAGVGTFGVAIQMGVIGTD